MSKNTCTPTRIFAPVDKQTLFMGASVMSATASLGINGQSGELTVQLVEDPCDTIDKIYYDQLLEEQIIRRADSFVPPVIGAPYYFRVGDFEFAGLVQSFTENQGGNGNTFTVRLTDPSVILSGCELIISDYGGSVKSLPNIFNLYAYAQTQLGTNCPSTVINGAQFGSITGKFGGNHYNSNGMMFNYMRDSLSLLTSSIPSIINDYSPYGRIVYRGNPFDSTFGALPADDLDQALIMPRPDGYPDLIYGNRNPYLAYYHLDLSCLPEAPSYYRFSGPSVTISEVIDQLAQDAGFSWYPTLEFVRLGNQIIKVIKIRTIFHTSQPTLGNIAAFISANDKVMDRSAGQELVSEVSSHLLIGAPVENIYQAPQSIISQFWGFYNNGNIIETQTDDDGNEYILVETADLNLSLNTPLTADSVRIYLDELRYAIHDKDVWELWQDTFGEDRTDTIKQALGFELHAVFTLNKVVDILRADPDKLEAMLPRDIVAGFMGGGVTEDKTNPDIKDLDKIFQWVQNFATEYYGRKFMIELPYTCVYKETETNQIVTTDEPAESGWTDARSIIGIPHPTLTDFFGEENGKILPFVGYLNLLTNEETQERTDKYDISELDIEQYFLYNDVVYIGARIGHPELVYRDKQLRTSPRVVIEISSPLPLKQNEDVVKKEGAGVLNILIDAARREGVADAETKIADISKKVENRLLYLPQQTELQKPGAAAVPLRNNTITYGPWYLAGPPGKSQVTQDTELAPWNYGSTSIMNTAGQSKVLEAVTAMQVSEMGSIQVPGYPALGLGYELNYGAPSLADTRSVLTKNSSTITDSSGQPLNAVYLNTNDDIQWTGLYGPNITSISVEVGQGGIVTTYEFRSYTPKFGRFSRGNSERLKTLGLQGLKNARYIRSAYLNQIKVKSINVRRKAAAERRNMHPGGATPNSVFIGSSHDSMVTGEKREVVGLDKITHLNDELTTEYGNKAFMSLDGLVRPFSTDGSGNLSPYYKSAGSGSDLPRNANRSEYAEPPTKTYKGKNVALDVIDPLRPNQGDNNDIEILGFGETPPEESLVTPIRRAGGGNESDEYRAFALRGPLIIKGWGLDTQGKPIPNSVDSEEDARLGQFEPNDLTDSFMDGFSTKSDCWPVGPVDLRFDRKRGVWVAPPAYRMPIATLKTALRGNSSATAYIKNGQVMYDQDGNPLNPGDETAREITVWSVDRKQSAAAGDSILVYYDNVEDKYYGIVSGANSGKLEYAKVLARPYMLPGLNFDTVEGRLVKDANGTEYTAAELQPGDDIYITIKLMARDWQEPDLLPGDVIAVMRDDEPVEFKVPIDLTGSSGVSPSGTVLSNYTCISDYSHDVGVIAAVAYTDSLPPQFPNVGITYRPPLKHGAVGNATISSAVNFLRQPIKAGQGLFVFRTHGNNNLKTQPTFGVLQASFGELCVLTDLDVTAFIKPPNGQQSSSDRGRDSFQIRVQDRKIYLESAWGNPGDSGEEITLEVKSYCCSSSSSYYYDGGRKRPKTDVDFINLPFGQECRTPTTYEHSNCGYTTTPPLD